jgi:hypothetical protein
VTHATYRYASQLPLRASADTLYVNWSEITQPEQTLVGPKDFAG